MDKKDSDGFISTRLVYKDSDSSYNTTDQSLILILISLLSSKASWLLFCTADLAGLACAIRMLARARDSARMLKITWKMFYA